MLFSRCLPSRTPEAAGADDPSCAAARPAGRAAAPSHSPRPRTPASSAPPGRPARRPARRGPSRPASARRCCPSSPVPRGIAGLRHGKECTGARRTPSNVGPGTSRSAKNAPSGGRPGPKIAAPTVQWLRIQNTDRGRVRPLPQHPSISVQGFSHPPRPLAHLWGKPPRDAPGGRIRRSAVTSPSRQGRGRAGAGRAARASRGPARPRPTLDFPLARPSLFDRALPAVGAGRGRGRGGAEGQGIPRAAGRR